MEVSLMKKTTILYIFLTALLLWTSFAGGRMRYDSKTAMDAGINVKETSEKATPSDQQASNVHDRLLRANTKDYGSYDPAPALGKPPFKLIPN